MTIRKKHERVIEKKKESRDSALMRGTEDLLALGVDLETLGPTAESVARLAALRPSSLEATRAVACWLGFAEIPEAAEALAVLEEAARDKEVKREIRRSIFRLEQKGVTVPRRAPDSGASILLTREADHAYLSPVDGCGDQVIWYVKSETSGDYFILSGVVNDRRGLLESDAGRVARPAFREILERTGSRFSLRLLPADPAYCDLLLHEAYRRSASKRLPGVSRFPSLRSEISHRVPEKVPCPVHGTLGDERVAAEPEHLDGSGRLLDEPELKGWLLDPEWLAPHLEAMREVADSPLVLNKYQAEERLLRVLDAAGAVIFAGEARGAYHRRLEAMAYYFLLAGREEAARRALAVSLVLGSETSAPDPVTVPFVVEITRRSFAVAREAERARAEEEKRSTLVIKPGEQR
ncbi:MAG TPA: hypothetical protein VKL61_07280 [Candidatus Polarisedimenticolia bacterium]|nr:hypothetical protein [Candidatus Polarisedimenticolia bacterium]